MSTAMATVARKSSNKYPPAYFGSPPSPNPLESDDEEPVYPANTENCSSSEEDTADDEQTVMVQFFKKIYKDPHQDIMEMLDGHAAEVLRTGRITVAGNAGDMKLLQPLLFSLQATEAELPIILPELLRNPFYKQKELGRQFAGQGGFFTSATADNFLSNGFFRLQVPIDQVIYELIQSHCCKGPGAVQAEALINSAFSVAQYASSGAMHHVTMAGENAPAFIPVGYASYSREQTSKQDEERDDLEKLPENFTKISQSSLASDSGCSSISDSLRKNSSVDLDPMEGAVYQARHPALNRCASLQPKRRVSVFERPPIPYSRPLTPGLPMESSKYSADSTNTWQCSVQHNMIVGEYGDNSYSLLTWNTDLKLEVQLTGSQAHGSHVLDSSPAVIDSRQPVLTISIKNPTDHTVAFSIRASRQSKLFIPHIIYPNEGLHLLRAEEVWEREMDVVQKDTDWDEHFIIDILVCAMEGAKPSWNVSRQYAVLRHSTQVEQPKALRRISKGNPTYPGAFSFQPRDLGYTLKQVMLHGLQAVVKNKLDEAETIFSHALKLPLFQRVPLKAFAYICLAVLANKRRKKEQLHRVGIIVSLVNYASKLVHSCEASQSMQMPKMVSLVNQLKKELDIKKVIRENRPQEPTTPVVAEATTKGELTRMINGAGGVIDLENEQLMVPGGALSHDTMICFSRDDPDKLRESVECSHWSGMLNLISVIKIQCQPPVIQFNKPVLVTVPLPEELWNKPFLQLRLFQSNYMSNWQDITNEPHSKVEVVGAANSRVQIKTNYTGWLIVAHIDFDVNKVMQMAIRSVLVAEPLVVTINVFGCIFPDNHAQVVAFLKSSSSSEDNSTQQKVRAPPGFVPIAFPRTIKVHVGQRLRLELQGNDFESCSGPSTEFTVDDPLNQIVEKTVKMDSTKMLRGQLIISSYCNSPKGWKKLEDIDLVTGTHSAKNGYSH